MIRYIAMAILCYGAFIVGLNGGYGRGFANGTMEAYSHIDDNDPRCK